MHYVNGIPRVSRVDFSDGFEKLRQQKIDSGLVKTMPLVEYRDYLRDKVMYWTDSGFVTEGQLRLAETAHNATSGK